MILDWSQPGPNEEKMGGGKLLLDGREIKSVWYVDTEAGIVKSYEVFGEGKLAYYCDEDTIRMRFPDGVPENVDAPLNDIFSITLKGKIEMFTKDGEKYEG